MIITAKLGNEYYGVYTMMESGAGSSVVKLFPTSMKGKLTNADKFYNIETYIFADRILVKCVDDDETAEKEICDIHKSLARAYKQRNKKNSSIRMNRVEASV